MPLSNDELAALTERLVAAQDAGDHFPPFLEGLAYDDGLAIQVRLLERFLAAGGQLGGWKVGLTSPRAREMFGVDERPFGFIDAARVLPSGSVVRAADMAGARIEPEMCFTVGTRLAGAAPTPGEVEAALATVSAGYELNHRPRGTLRPDLAMATTTRMYNWGIVVGSGIPVADAPDLNGVFVRMRCDGAVRLADHCRNQLDDHFSSISRLVAGLHRCGLALEPGQRVITGALGAFDASPGELWQTRFEGIGDVEVRFE